MKKTNYIKFLDNAYAKNGTNFISTSLENVLYNCLSLPKDGEKGKYGSVFVYDADQLGNHKENETSTGIILVDIDNINKETAETIYEYFELLADLFPSLLAIQYSSSYYINPNKNGLHIYVKSEKLSKDDYKKYSQICLAIIAQLIERHLGINLLKMGDNVLDTHNTNLYQRFNLFYSTFKYNERAVEFDLDKISFEDLEKLVMKYKLTLDTTVTRTIAAVSQNMKMGDTSKRICVDRNLKIGPYKGNDIRFRISIIATKLFGDNAKYFCDKYFYYENNKSIYTHYPSGNTENPLIKKWLIENGFIEENNEREVENWLTEYKDEIVKEISKNKKLEIVAPTGCGKTTLINDYLAKELNAVVIVPFNVTNKLYDKLVEVNANYGGKLPENKPIVMIWDQAIKHWEVIKHRQILVDEAHTLFFDRNYRDAAIKLINKLVDAKVTFITATPAGEGKLFKAKTIRYFKKRKFINLNIKAVANIEWAQYNYVKKCLDNNWYDRIVILDDNSAKKLWEKFNIEGYGCDICYIRADQKDSTDFIDLRESELLKKKLTICTCIAYNGLNFKNKDENILVIGSIKQGQTTSCEIIQQIGRIRDSKVHGLYFYDPEKYYVDDIEKKVEKANEYNLLVASGCPDTFLSYERRYLNDDFVEALKNIQLYTKKHSTIDKIIEELGATGYIQGKVNDEKSNDKILKMTLELKRKESNQMKNDLITGLFEDKNYDDEENIYKSGWAKDINYLVSSPQYRGIDLNFFIDMIQNTHKNNLIETIIGSIREKIRIVQVDEQQYEDYVKNRKLYANMISDAISRRDFLKQCKKIDDIRKKYKDIIYVENEVLILTQMTMDIIAEEAERINKSKENMAGKKTKKIKDLETGIIYESGIECAKTLGVTKSYISKHKDRFIKI